MKTLSAIAILSAVMLPVLAQAGTSCTTRKSGSVTITSCSNTYKPGGFTQCRSYMSGSVKKTSCR